MGTVTAVKDCRGTLEERLLRRVHCNLTTHCWNFTGAISKSGYGSIGVATGKSSLAHRESYKIFKGPIPHGTELHHTCENRRCVNPDHLLPVTRREHHAVTPRHVSHRTHCPRGHPLTEDNLVPSAIAKYGARKCATCARQRSRRHYETNKEKKRAYEQANRERINAASRARYAADPDRFIEYQKQWKAQRHTP